MTVTLGKARVCEKCGCATVYIEFRDQFPRDDEKFIPRANGVWMVCHDCGHEWSGDFRKDAA